MARHHNRRTRQTQKPKNVGGRPSDYLPEYADLVYNYALLGATDGAMATFFNISEVTFNAWKKKHPRFLKSMRAGKAQADARVARSLYARAIGYEHPEVDIRAVKGKIRKTSLVKFYPPDTAAATFWLRNRQPELWRDVQRGEISGPNGGPIPVVEAGEASVEVIEQNLLRIGAIDKKGNLLLPEYGGRAGGN